MEKKHCLKSVNKHYFTLRWQKTTHLYHMAYNPQHCTHWKRQKQNIIQHVRGTTNTIIDTAMPWFSLWTSLNTGGKKMLHICWQLSNLASKRDWHVGLWQVLRSFNKEETLVRAVQTLYQNASNAVLLNSQLGKLSKTTVGVCQGCLLSPILFNLFLEKIMQETLDDHHISISIGGKSIYATYDLLPTSILWAPAMVNFKTAPTDTYTEQWLMEWKSAQKRARSWTTSVQKLAWLGKS